MGIDAAEARRAIRLKDARATDLQALCPDHLTHQHYARLGRAALSAMPAAALARGWATVDWGITIQALTPDGWRFAKREAGTGRVARGRHCTEFREDALSTSAAHAPAPPAQVRSSLSGAASRNISIGAFHHSQRSRACVGGARNRRFGVSRLSSR